MSQEYHSNCFLLTALAKLRLSICMCYYSIGNKWYALAKLIKWEKLYYLYI